MTKALLVMDVQEAVVARYPDPDYLPRLAGAISFAHERAMPVIYVTVGFRDGAPEVSASNRMFGRLRGMPGRPNPIHPDVAPRPGDIVVVKRRVSAFTGSDLDVVLRAQGVRELVLTGIATSGVVLSTLREAADRDFELTVLADGCLDNDPEVHRVLVEKVFPMQAEVTSIAAFTA
ncbi:cysteine hydrolase family protein [Paractinoplanes lichenicola]|uniref:Cysteine hydrolase n=1 Tax=Paractinoplanes lichenicola TaxID=2802976 RepID=A0ABS1VWH4_9ACTN|nr:isochorismatase family cysteine hydrolase [Actinoplanes lichenicola]MBL7258842.1 cysteine hydrolase [Actinoplanes lichenicola]